ncbi:hypothetical protein INR49_011964 [Caranx melampygus]|nr:hypothetical protein INR49_011964 [Caranx melampygus]
MSVKSVCKRVVDGRRLPFAQASGASGALSPGTSGLAEMEEKLRVIFDDRIEKLVLPSGIPPTVEELQTTVKENFGFSEEQVDENLDISFGQHSTDCDSVSYAESSASIAESSASNAESLLEHHRHWTPYPA